MTIEGGGRLLLRESAMDLRDIVSSDRPAVILVMGYALGDDGTRHRGTDSEQ